MQLTEYLEDVGPAAAHAALPPTPASVGTVPGTSPPPWLGSVPQGAAAASHMGNKPSPGACGGV